MKYVIIVEREGTKKGATRIYHAVLFADHLIHEDMVPSGYVAVGAGECAIRGNLGVSVHGKSETLGLVCSPADAIFIQQWLLYGESMAVMASESYDTYKVCSQAQIIRACRKQSASARKRLIRIFGR